MSVWGYTVDCRPEVSSNNLDSQQSVKKLRRDTCSRIIADTQECGSSWPLNLRGGAEFEEDSYQPGRFHYLVDDPTAFLEDEVDASVVSSSYQFSLPDGMELFDQQTPAPAKQMDESWDAINGLNNLGDMDDIFGNSSFVQPNSLEVQSVSSSPDSGMTRRVASSSGSPDEKHAGVNISPVLAPPQNCLNKPVYWVAQQQQQQPQPETLRSCGEYQPPIIVGPGPGSLFSDTTSLESSAPQTQQQLLQGSMSYKAFGGPLPGQEFDQKPVSGELRANQTSAYAEPPAERCGTNNLATTSGREGTLEAAVLYQLGSTMSKLDVGTRLSIRNALYRLAKGACSRIGDGEESASSHHRQVRSPASIACLETCTNKIDRTVAGLLFYRNESQQTPPTPDSVSPHSAISSSNNHSCWPDQTGSTSDHERVPVVMMCGSKPLPLPPVYNHSGYSELLSGKRGRTM